VTYCVAPKIELLAMNANLIQLKTGVRDPTHPDAPKK
jgi:hypothetical protein